MKICPASFVCEVMSSEATQQDNDGNFAVFQSFLEGHHKTDILHILEHEDPSMHFSVVVNALELFDSNLDVGQALLDSPVRMLLLFDSALAQAATNILHASPSQQNLKPKANLHVRLSNLPVCPELRRNTIPKSSDVGRFLAISGKNSQRQWARDRCGVRGGGAGERGWGEGVEKLCGWCEVLVV